MWQPFTQMIEGLEGQVQEALRERDFFRVQTLFLMERSNTWRNTHHEFPARHWWAVQAHVDVTGQRAEQTLRRRGEFRAQ
jgi:hypothetical protein